MKCTVVVGGQYGSEGKGKVVSLCAERSFQPWIIRCGGPNSGHTVNIDGRMLALRQIPAGAGRQDAILLLAAGCVIDEDVFLTEVNQLKIDRHRLIVDPRAVLVTPYDRVAEQSAIQQIGSTGSGNGSALIRRMRRESGVAFSSDSPKIRERASD